MPIIFNPCPKSSTLLKCFLNHVRFASKSSSKWIIKNIPENEIQKSVFISQSNNIFVNLALEDWFYRNYDFTRHHVLLLWKNDPCVVIGRHQNPWMECNTAAAEQNGIQIARRNSGGGTVYHDRGNLNLSFFTPRERYDRRYNLEIILKALYREFGIESIINKKEDILVENEFKISGTAAKLGNPNAYHHCTLLVDADKSLLRSTLKKGETSIITNATQSVPSPVKNLKEINPHVTVDKLLASVGWEYLRTLPMSGTDGGHELIKKQKGFQMINPTEDWFPGLDNLLGEFHSWNWNFGRTPNFSIIRQLEFPKEDGHHKMKLTINVEKGIIQSIKMTPPEDSVETKGDVNVMTNLCGKRYCHEITDNIVTATGCKVIPVNSGSLENNIAAIQ